MNKPINLHAIDVTHGRAHSGPWEVVRVSLGDTQGWNILGPGARLLFTTNHEGSANFIVTAQAVIPSLLARVRELEEELKRAQSHLNDVKTQAKVDVTAMREKCLRAAQQEAEHFDRAGHKEQAESVKTVVSRLKTLV